MYFAERWVLFLYSGRYLEGGVDGLEMALESVLTLWLRSSRLCLLIVWIVMYFEHGM
jgi:hypothetical protein